MQFKRVTVEFDDDVARMIRDAQRREGKTISRVVNDAVRRGLSAPSSDVPQYQVRPHHSTVRPGVDMMALNRLADEPDDD